MAQVVISNTGSSNKNMRLRVTYEAGNGAIYITKLEGCRTDGYDTLAYNANTGDNIVYVRIGGTQVLAVHVNNINFTMNWNYSTIWSGSVGRTNLSGSTGVEVSFYATVNSNINNAYFYTPLDAGYANPTLSVSGAGSSESNKVTLGTSGANVSLVVGNTVGRTCTLKLNGTDTYTTYNSDGTKTFALPATLLSQHSGDNDFSVTVQIYTGNLYSETKTIWIHIDNSIIPTISDFTISAVNDIQAFGTNFIQGISKASISFTASGAGGSSISSYIIESIGGFNADLFPYPINSSSYQTTNTFVKEGTYAATGKVIDTRQRPSATAATTQYTVIPYSNASVKVTPRRCDSDGTLNNDGTSCKLTIEYNFSPVNDGSNDLNTKSVEYSLDGTTWVPVTLSNWRGTTDVIITSQTFATNSQYNIYIKYADRVLSTTDTKVLEKAFVLISRLNGTVGNGVTLGRVATEPGFNCYLDADFKGTVTQNGQPIGGGITLNDIYPVGSVYMTFSTTFNPNTVWAGTTWERLPTYRMLIAAGGGINPTTTSNSYTGRGTFTGDPNWAPAGETGGETDTALAAGNLPGHTHSGTVSWVGDHSHGIPETYYARMSGSGGSFTGAYNDPYNKSTGAAGGHNHTFTTDNGSGLNGTAHNNMPPYIAVCMWKRTA